MIILITFQPFSFSLFGFCDIGTDGVVLGFVLLLLSTNVQAGDRGKPYNIRQTNMYCMALLFFIAENGVRQKKPVRLSVTWRHFYEFPLKHDDILGLWFDSQHFWPVGEVSLVPDQKRERKEGRQGSRLASATKSENVQKRSGIAVSEVSHVMRIRTRYVIFKQIFAIEMILGIGLEVHLDNDIATQVYTGV